MSKLNIVFAKKGKKGFLECVYLQKIWKKQRQTTLKLVNNSSSYNKNTCTSHNKSCNESKTWIQSSSA